MDKKDKIRPLYSELQGYLSQAPSVDGKSSTLYEELYKQPDSTIDELNEVTGQDYNKFKIQPLQGSFGPFARVEDYRSKLGGLISRLHGEFFSDEPAPFSGMPSTIINQNQSQSVNIQMIVELTEKITQQANKFDEGTPERGFLEKIKKGLSNIKNIADVLNLVFESATQYGLSLEKIKDILS